MRPLLDRRALEEWERTICENKAVAILERLQEGRPPLFQQDGGAMLIAIVLDRPLQEAQALVDQPLQFLQEIKRLLDDQKEHPILERMLRTIQGDAMKQDPRSASTYKKQSGTQREKKHVLTVTLMLVRRKSACKTSAGSSEILRWLTPLLGPNMDPKIGPRIGSHFHSFF